MRWLLVLICCSSAAWASPQHDRRSWPSSYGSSSPYRATLTEDEYNFGESNEFSLRIDAQRSDGDNGWFFVVSLDAGGATHSPKPQLVWTTATDLLVTVHTADLEGQTIRKFGGKNRSRGSVTVRYIAYGPPIY